MTAGPDRMCGPGGVRALRARWVLCGELVLETAAHLGGTAVTAVDMPVLRDERDGSALLTGASLAGALRSYLADRLGGYGCEEPRQVAQVLGGVRGDDEGMQSSLIVFDSRGKMPGEAGIEFRDGVKIAAATGTAEEHKKFDLEVLPVGTSFPLRFDLLVPEQGDEATLLRLLHACLNGLAQGEVPLGARGTRGLGRCTVTSWQARRYDLSTRQDWLEWLASDWEAPLVERPTEADLAAALAAAWPPAEELQPFETDRRQRLVADVRLSWPGAGLLVRRTGVLPGEADVAHLSSSAGALLPGSALAGALRSRALRVLGVVLGSNEAASEKVDHLFGPQLEGTSDLEFEPAGSRIVVSEGVVENGVSLRPARIRVNRFTGGVVDGALFDEEPVYGGTARLRIEIRSPVEGETGLLLLLLKDLLCEDLPIGGAASVGRGIASGSVEISTPDGARMAWNPSEPVTCARTRSFLNHEVDLLHQSSQSSGLGKELGS